MSIVINSRCSDLTDRGNTLITRASERSLRIRVSKGNTTAHGACASSYRLGSRCANGNKATA